MGITLSGVALTGCAVNNPAVVDSPCTRGGMFLFHLPYFIICSNGGEVCTRDGRDRCVTKHLFVELLQTRLASRAINLHTLFLLTGHSKKKRKEKRTALGMAWLKSLSTNLSFECGCFTFHTLYLCHKRIGRNTKSPSWPLTVWSLYLLSQPPKCVVKNFGGNARRRSVRSRSNTPVENKSDLSADRKQLEEYAQREKEDGKTGG